MSDDSSARPLIVSILSNVLPDALPGDWDDERPLTEAGLDSVAVLEIVGALESRAGVTLADEDLDVRNFMTIAGLVALVERRGSRA